VRKEASAQLCLRLFGGGMEEDIYKRLKQVEEHYVRAVRELEKLANALEHVLPELS
jgi:hypothetical protein